MSTLLIPCVALLASTLTFFSGFGLGTLLMPAFAIFYPPDMAIVATAIVHLSNNLFKLLFTANYINRALLVRFGIPAVLAGLGGAWMLHRLETLEPIASYTIGYRLFEVDPLKLVIGILMIVFAVLELLPICRRLHISPRWMPVGGIISGFFGGLSGHQGALRSAFLARAEPDARRFIGTTVVITIMVDFARMAIYARTQQHVFQDAFADTRGPVVVLAIIAALLGSLIGSRWLHKVTIGFVQGLVGMLLLALGLALATGII